MTTSTRVVIVQRMLPSYRIAFFRELHANLARDCIGLELYYGRAYPDIEAQTVRIDDPWAHYIHNHYYELAGTPLVWQPCWRAARSADLVVLEQANRLAINYPFLLEPRRHRRAKVALWGHGKNFQAETPNSPREILKRRMLTRADWWFAYTAGTAESIAAAGFPRERITAVQNAIDTQELERSIREVTPEQLAHLRNQLGIGQDDPVAVYCGAMHKDKRLPFLVSACDVIRSRHANFHIVFVGDGPERHIVETAAQSRPWLHAVGAIRGPERARYLRLGAAMLMPGLVGLAVVDCFVARTPLITTVLPIHSPEFEYLTPGVDGLVTAHEVDAYAHAVCAYLDDPGLQQSLARGCAEAARRYTLEKMVENFASGIRASLGRPHPRSA